MKLSFVDYFVNLASLLLVLNDFQLLEGGIALISTLVRREEGQNLAVETESALLLCCLRIKFRTD